MRIYKKLFDKIIDAENLFLAWDEFKHDKRNRSDVLQFEKKLEQSIFSLNRDLRGKVYKHGPYTDFFIYDPKLRHIHKATVLDRIIHHAIFKILNGVFEPTFIATSFSCRISKGTHKGVSMVEKMIRRVSQNYTQPCYALKCDVKKFFDTVDHSILLSILQRKIKDADVMWLMEEIVESFVSEYSSLTIRRGLPIGNLTSQLFANVYMNEFDQFMKKELKVEYYARYTDDFVVISRDKKYLEQLLEPIKKCLQEKLQLELHPKKISIEKYSHGVDFLGYVVLPHYRLMRKRTLKRIVRNLRNKVVMYKQGLISKQSLHQTLQSYLGVLSHADTFHLSQNIHNNYWFWLNE